MKRLLFVLGEHNKVDKDLWHKYTDSQLRGMDLPAHQVDQGEFLDDTNLKTLTEDLGVPAEYCGIYNTKGEEVPEALSLNEIVARRTEVRKQAEHDLDEFNKEGAVLLEIETKEGLEEAVKTAKKDEEWAKKRKVEHEGKINEKLCTSSAEARVAHVDDLDDSILNPTALQVERRDARNIIRSFRTIYYELAEPDEDRIEILYKIHKLELELIGIEEDIEGKNKAAVDNEYAKLNSPQAKSAATEANNQKMADKREVIQDRQVLHESILEICNIISKSMKKEAAEAEAKERIRIEQEKEKEKADKEQAAKAQAGREKAEEKEIEIVDEKGEEEQGKEKEKGEGTGTEAGTGTEKGKEKEIEIVDEKGEEEQGKEKEAKEKAEEKEIEIVDEKGEEEQGGGKEEEQGSGGQAQA
ncbi:hypothetical protein AGMMS49593_00520 [Endomicrobiia bacterium]|nr:hypothetical protein AGMMS49593_00520 [Endomicrobiia bacterium]